MRAPRLKRAVRIGLYGLAAAHVVETMILRRRARQLVRLRQPGVGSPDTAVAPDPTSVEVIQVAGTAVDSGTLAAVAQEMQADANEAARVEVVDLVPGDLPPDRALRLLRRVEPDRVHRDPLYAPGGAHEVVVQHPSVAKRMAERPDALNVRSGPLDRGDLVRHSAMAQRYAPASSVLRVAPSLRVSSGDGHDRWRELEEANAWMAPWVSLAPALAGMETAHLAAMTAGLVFAPLPAMAALLAWSAQPLLVFGAGHARDGGGDRATRSGLTPPDVARSSLLRLPVAWGDNIRTLLAGWHETRAKASRHATGLPVGEKQIRPIPPAEELFDPRHETCPWCGAGALVQRLATTDLLQNKPGSFHLDECAECGHIFQNPPLSVQGLDYYYDQFYDGDGEEALDTVFAGQAAIYRRRADAVAQFTEPRAWLDVGAGHGHFCLAARDQWPSCRFDGLDMSDSIDEALRRGWIDGGFRGFFPDLAPEMGDLYDVVSMHHYLEHTREPRRELRAAARVLQPGGYLMIEVPDPDSPLSRLLGRYWLPWLQPQHQHFVRCENLSTALEATGFEVLSVERGPATMSGDLVMAGTLLLQRLAPSPHGRWRPPTSPSRRAARVGMVTAAVPFLVAAATVDMARDAWVRRPGSTSVGNAYRIVARRS